MDKNASKRKENKERGAKIHKRKKERKIEKTKK